MPDYQEFRRHPVISALAGNRRWTVSGRTAKGGDGKVPLSLNGLDRNLAYGAGSHEYPETDTLDAVHELIPLSGNQAYFLDMETDGLVCLDVEKTCPAEMKNELLKSDFVYGERSMSGLGLHLFYPVPACLEDYPDARVRTVIKSGDKTLELLMQHWVTFTRDRIEPPADPDPAIFPALAEALFKEVKPKASVEGVDGSLVSDIGDIPDIPFKDEILYAVRSQRPSFTLEDKGGDNSHWEASCATFYAGRVGRLVHGKRAPFRAQIDGDYTDEQWIYLTCLALREFLPYREKHDGVRDGMPWLLYLSRDACMYVKRNEQEEREAKKKDLAEKARKASAAKAPAPIRGKDG